MVHQRGEELGFEHLEASAGEPNEVGEQLGEDNGGLFGLDDAYSLWLMGGGGKQVEAEEAVLEGETFRELVLEDGVNPSGVVGLVAVTVGLVLHQFASVDTLLLVDLPEDDAAFFGGTEAVAVGGVVHLLGGEVALRDEGLAESGLSGEGFLDEVGGEWDECGGVRGGSWRGVGWRSGPDRGQVHVSHWRLCVSDMYLSPVRVNDGDVELADEPVAGFDEGEVLVVLH